MKLARAICVFLLSVEMYDDFKHMLYLHPAAVRCDMVLHRAFRARRVRKTGIGGEVRHGVTSGVSCETCNTSAPQGVYHLLDNQGANISKVDPKLFTSDKYACGVDFQTCFVHKPCRIITIHIIGHMCIDKVGININSFCRVCSVLDINK